jgi:hypothetical protein
MNDPKSDRKAPTKEVDALANAVLGLLPVCCRICFCVAVTL